MFDNTVVNTVLYLVGFGGITQVDFRLGRYRLEGADHCLNILGQVCLVFPVERFGIVCAQFDNDDVRIVL